MTCEHDRWTSHQTMTSTHTEYTCTDCDAQWNEPITYSWACQECGAHGNQVDGPELVAIQSEHFHGGGK